MSNDADTTIQTTTVDNTVEKLELNTVGLFIYRSVTATEGTANVDGAGAGPAWDCRGYRGSPDPTGIIYSITASTSGDGAHNCTVVEIPW